MPQTNFNSDAQAGFDAGQQASEHSFRQTSIEGVPITVTREGYTVTKHEDMLAVPLRRKGFIAVADLDGFCRLFNKFKGQYNDHAIIMVDSDPTGKRPATFKAILNHHGTDKPDHGDFGIIHTAAFSVEWNRWMSKNNQAMSHAGFVEHLEDVMDLIIDPPGADLLKLIESLQGTVNARFANALNLHNGKMKLNYEEDVEIRGASEDATRKNVMEVPSEITAGIAPFEFGEKYKVRNRIRYRVQNRGLTFSYEAIDPHRVIQDAVTAQILNIQKETESQPFQGKL